MFEQTTERVAFNKKLKLSEKLKKKKKSQFCYGISKYRSFDFGGCGKV